MDRISSSERALLAAELLEVDVELLRARLTRERPDAAPAEIEAEVFGWLQRRPDAPEGCVWRTWEEHCSASPRSREEPPDEAVRGTAPR